MKKILLKVASKYLLSSKEKPNYFINFDGNFNISKIDNLPIFITGTGRSGTHFLTSIFKGHQNTFTIHLDTVNKPVGDAFEVYSQWYKLPVSHQGFINSRNHLINKANSSNKKYIESNPLLAFSLKDLNTAFKGKYVIVFREPKKVVESHYRKGWYGKTRNVTDGIPPGFEYFHDRPNHFFSRIAPSDKNEYNKWKAMTRLGKVSWMWAATYKRIFQDLDTIPKKNIYFLNINSFNFKAYKNVCSFLNLDIALDEDTFDKIVNKKPGKGVSNKVNWTKQSKKEFDNQIASILPHIPSNWNVEHWLFKNN